MSSPKRVCLICTRDIQKSSLITHIAEHLNYKRHKCSDCSFQSVMMETMVDHQNNTSHKVKFDVTNWYLERVCQLIYSDFEYALKNGGDSIRKFGSVYGDSKRLTEMLKSCEVKEEDDEIEVIATPHEIQNRSTQPNVSVPFVRRSLPESSKQQADTNSKTTTQLAHNQCLSFDSVKRLRNLQPKNAQTPHNQQEVEKVRPSDAVMNVQTAPADSSNEHAKGQEQILAELHRQITKGIERKMCKICHQMVDNDYKSQKEHVLLRHMICFDENKGDKKLRWKLEQCFKQEGHLLVTNDFQCNICGHGTKYKDTRYHHVSAVHTDYQWDCVFPSCDFVVRSKKQFNGHLNSWHKMNLNQLEGKEKDSYIMMNSDFEHKLTPLVRKCFPFDLINANSAGEEEERKKRRKVGKSREEDALADSVVSSFMPTVDHSALNRLNQVSPKMKIKKRVKHEYESPSDSDYTDSEHESKPETKDSELGQETMSKSERTSSSSARQQRTIYRSIERTHSTTRRSAEGSSLGNGYFYSAPKNNYRPGSSRMREHTSNYESYYNNRRSRAREGYYETPLKGPRHETKKQKIEGQSDSVVYFRR